MLKWHEQEATSTVDVSIVLLRTLQYGRSKYGYPRLDTWLRH